MSPSDERTSKASRWRSLVRVLWTQPLWAVPFAIFFGTLWGDPRFSTYLLAYKLSLIFAYAIGLALWANEQFVVPKLMCNVRDDVRDGNWSIGFSFGLASLVASYIAAAIIHYTLLPGFLGSARAFAISGMFTLLFFGLFAGINFARAFYQQAIERARAVEQIRAELAEAELRALRAQINPHFLFNTLNTIASLIRTNPADAEDTTTRLADIFRYVLRASETGQARLGEELEFLRAYLEIERMRFGDRLRLEEKIEPGLDSVPVPSFLLQPLVENAVRYAVAQRMEGGLITLSAWHSGDRLTLEVRDDGPGMNGSATPSGMGFGLHSVRERLRAAGPPHAIEIDSGPGRGTTVRLTLPLISPSPTSPPSSKGAES